MAMPAFDGAERVPFRAKRTMMMVARITVVVSFVNDTTSPQRLASLPFLLRLRISLQGNSSHAITRSDVRDAERSWSGAVRV
jgi:hypothetical protein